MYINGQYCTGTVSLIDDDMRIVLRMSIGPVLSVGQRVTLELDDGTIYSGRAVERIDSENIVLNNAPSNESDLSEITETLQDHEGRISALENDPGGGNLEGLAAVATSGSYTDLVNKPDLATVAVTGSYLDLADTPTFSSVAQSGDYDELTEKPQIGGVTLMGNRTLPELGVAADNHTHSASEITSGLGTAAALDAGEDAGDVAMIVSSSGTLVSPIVACFANGGIRKYNTTLGSATKPIYLQSGNIREGDSLASGAYQGELVADYYDAVYPAFASGSTWGAQQTYTPTKSGYTLIGAIGISGVGTVNLIPYSYSVSGGKIYLRLYNPGNSAYGATTWHCFLLWKKNS